MRTLIFTALLLTSFVQFAHANPLVETDNELNATYQQALKAAANPKLLRESQRHWLKYAKTHCTAAKANSNEPEFASGWELVCFDDLAKARIHELKNSYLKN